MSGRLVTRRGVAQVGIAAAVIGSAAPAAIAAGDRVVTLWAETQALDAEWERVSTEQSSLRERIVSCRPGQPKGVRFDEWHRGDPDLARCELLLGRSDEIGKLTCDHYDKIAEAVAVTPEGIRAKCAAALCLWAKDRRFSEDVWYYDLILNALREAAAGSASA